MQTSLSRRQRRRRLNDKRRPRGSGVAKYVALAIPLFLFTTIALLGVAGATTFVAGYSFLSKDLPDPKKTLEAIDFDQQTAVWDRTGKVLLARLGSDRRELVTFDQIPPVLVDATTAIEDKTFWENSGFDPIAFAAAAIDTIQGNDRGGSTITQQLVRARLLPESAFADSVYERKAREIIQSIRLTEAYPGTAGKQAIMESYLNNNYYGNRSYGVAAAAQSYWKKDLKDLTLAQYALLAGIPKSPTAYDLVQNATEEEYTDENGKVQTRLVVPQNAQVVRRRDQILELMKTRSDLSGGTYTDADFEAAKAEPVILAEQGGGCVARAALRVAGAQGARRAAVRRAPVREDRHRRLQGDHLARLQDAADHREVGLRGRDDPQQQEPGRSSSRRARSRARSGRGSRACAATASTTPRRASSTTAPARSSPTPGRPPTRPRAPRRCSPSSTSWPTAGASRDRRSSRSSTSSASTTRR